jgi:hypothetical protein
LLEIDTLPAVAAKRSRFACTVPAGGLSFTRLINSILGLAVGRYRLGMSLAGKKEATALLNKGSK